MTDKPRRRKKTGNTRKQFFKEDMLISKMIYVTQSYQTSLIEEICNAFREKNIIAVIQSKRLSWQSHILKSNTIA